MIVGVDQIGNACPSLHAAFVINRRVGDTLIGREARRALADQPLPVLVSEIRQRIVFAESVATGELVRERDADCLAGQEITALTQEVLRTGSP